MNTRSRDDLRLLGETILVVILTWVLLGWIFDRAITQADGTVQWLPYLRSSLVAGVDWTDHLYRFGVLGGSTMHDSAGTLPIIQVCAALGLGATTSSNVLIMFLQTSIAFFSVLLVRGLVGAWLPSARDLSRTQRIAVVWACAFAPWLGWRLAYGHENLVLGLLPLITCAGLVAAARHQAPSPVALVFGTFVVWNGLAGLGAQLVVYSVAFAAATVILLALEARARPRWGRAQWSICAALLAAILLVLPRLVGMIAHITGDDFPRSGSLTYSYGVIGWHDWLTSLPWMTGPAASTPPAIPIHESNVPVGPLALLMVLWPAVASRRLLVSVALAAVVAILFASDVSPVSDLVLRAVPPLASFRVPSRALLVVLALLTPIALAACYARFPDPVPPRAEGILLLVAVVVIAAGRFAPGSVREVLAVGIALAAIVIARWRPALAARALLPSSVVVLTALGVAAFDERFPRGLPSDPIEDGPRALHDRILAELPELAMPLARIQIVDPPRPYEMSAAFAAGLPSLDGAWYPTRRFIALLSALSGKPIDSTTGVFQLTRSRAFPVLQQLYNVRYELAYDDARGGVLTPLRPTPGAAWFPHQVDVIDHGVELARAIAGGANPAKVAWILRDDHAPAALAGCADATVETVATDNLGQSATIVVDSPRRCVLVVATNFVRSLHATSGSTELAVFPIDLALTGIEVTPGRATIVLGPRAHVPLWSRLASFLGLASVVIAVWLALRRRTASSAARTAEQLVDPPGE